MVEDDRLGALRAPVLEVDFRAVLVVIVLMVVVPLLAGWMEGLRAVWAAATFGKPAMPAAAQAARQYIAAGHACS